MRCFLTTFILLLAILCLHAESTASTRGHIDSITEAPSLQSKAVPGGNITTKKSDTVIRPRHGVKLYNMNHLSKCVLLLEMEKKFCTENIFEEIEIKLLQTQYDQGTCEKTASECREEQRNDYVSKDIDVLEEVLNEYSKELLSIENDETALNQSLNVKLVSKESEHQKQINNLKEKHKEEKKELNEKFEKLIQEEKKSWEKEIEELKLDFEERLSGVEKDNERARIRLKKSYDSSMLRAKTDFEESTANLKLENQERIQKLIIQYEASENKLKDDHKQEISQLKFSHEESLRTFKLQHQNVLTGYLKMNRTLFELQANLARVIHTYESESKIVKENCENEMSVLQLKSESEVSRLKNFTDSLILKLNSTFSTDTHILNLTYATQVENLKESLSSLLENVTNSARDEIRDIKLNAYTEAAAEFTDKILELKEELNDLKELRANESLQSYESNIRFKTFYEDQLRHCNTTILQYEKSVTVATTEISNLKKDINDCDVKCEKRIKDVKGYHDKEVNKNKDLCEKDIAIKQQDLEYTRNARDEFSKKLTSCTTTLTVKTRESDLYHSFCSGKSQSLNILNYGRYLFVNEERPWFGALQYCRRRGLNLISFESGNRDAKYNEVVHHIRSELYYKSDYWTGATTDEDSRFFYWSHNGNSAEISFLMLDGQPDNAGGDENCIEFTQVLNGDRVSSPGLNDDDCDDKKRFICELDTRCY